MCQSCDNVVERHAIAGENWSEFHKDDLQKGYHNACVGQVLVSENGRVRVWSIRLGPGERLGFHRHVLDYFWTAVTSGRARSHFDGGRVSETTYQAGDTKHMSFAAGDFMVHDLENIGDADLVFTTVEFLDSANRPLMVPANVRRQSNH